MIRPMAVAIDFPHMMRAPDWVMVSLADLEVLAALIILSSKLATRLGLANGSPRQRAGYHPPDRPARASGMRRSHRRPFGGWRRPNSFGLKSSDDTALISEEVVGAGVVPTVDSRVWPRHSAQCAVVWPYAEYPSAATARKPAEIGHSGIVNFPMP